MAKTLDRAVMVLKNYSQSSETLQLDYPRYQRIISRAKSGLDKGAKSQLEQAVKAIETVSPAGEDSTPEHLRKNLSMIPKYFY